MGENWRTDHRRASVAVGECAWGCAGDSGCEDSGRVCDSVDLEFALAQMPHVADYAESRDDFNVGVDQLQAVVKVAISEWTVGP